MNIDFLSTQQSLYAAIMEGLISGDITLEIEHSSVAVNGESENILPFFLILLLSLITFV